MSRRVRNALTPRRLEPGLSTAGEGLVEYRIAKLERLGLVRGDWLDCGSCDGYYAAALRERGATAVVGTDVDEHRVAYAKRLWAGFDGLEFITAPAESMPFRDGAFDGVLVNEVLEHVSDQEQALREIRRVLAPGGHVAIFGPNRWFPFEGHGARVGSLAINVPIPLLPWLPGRLVWRFMRARNYWPRQLRGLVDASGLEVVHVDFAFPLFTKFRWLPSGVIERYRRLVPTLEKIPGLRRFGISTLVVGRKTDAPGRDPRGSTARAA
jgi:SAM-dependent methyltransferase